MKYIAVCDINGIDDSYGIIRFDESRAENNDGKYFFDFGMNKSELKYKIIIDYNNRIQASWDFFGYEKNDIFDTYLEAQKDLIKKFFE